MLKHGLILLAKFFPIGFLIGYIVRCGFILFHFFNNYDWFPNLNIAINILVMSYILYVIRSSYLINNVKCADSLYKRKFDYRFDLKYGGFENSYEYEIAKREQKEANDLRWRVREELDFVIDLIIPVIILGGFCAAII